MDPVGNVGASSLQGVQDDLEQFRQQWRRELQRKSQEEGKEEDSQPADEDVHVKALEYFLQGVKMEENGKLYDAIKYYKKAVTLVPDIEKEAFQYTGKQAVKNNQGTSSGNGLKSEGGKKAEEELEMLNLMEKFSSVKLDNQPLIQPEVSTQSVHIGQLPIEVLNYILKWVVSSDLDFRSLEACSQVCRGFYLAARDGEIWRLICVRVWGQSILSSKETLWRNFYLSRAKVHFNGVYISKMTYIREGERSFQDHESYRAWHMVEYYRLIRLFPGGRILMTISADDPGLTAKLMNNKNFCSVQGAMFGEYRIVDSLLVCVLHKTKPKKIISKYGRKKRRDSMVYNDVPDQDFLLEFAIKGSKSRTLQWHSYKIVNKYSSGRERIDPVTLSDSNFPRMKFTRVGSYHFESSAPL